jgi:glycerophosphoryl diester phosphodiesterase
VVAHRGASRELPEHTLAAFAAAVRQGADALECDVRLTADGHLVCVHDRRIDRTSNGHGPVSTLELAQLEGLDWGSWKQLAGPDREAAERTQLLTLRRLLGFVAGCDRRVELAIETKHPTRYGGLVERALAQVLAEFGWNGPQAPVRMMSFSLLAVRRMQRLAPGLPLAFLIDRMPYPVRDGRLPRGVAIAAISVDLLRSDPAYVRRAHALGNAVHVWTVDEPDDVGRCLDAGVDAIITNRPAEVLALLGR